MGSEAAGPTYSAGESGQIEPLLDLLALPIASEVTLLLIAACLPIPWLRMYAVAAFAVLVFHLTAAAVKVLVFGER